MPNKDIYPVGFGKIILISDTFFDFETGILNFETFFIV